MELRQLEHFLALAEERHFTRTATRLHLAQSSLSSSVAALERELGADLLLRSTRRVELTEAGRALVPEARAAVAAAERGRDAVADVLGVLRGRLDLGAIQSLGGISLPGLLADYHRRHPAVRLRVRHDAVPQLVADVVAGDLDAALVDRPYRSEQLVERPLRESALVLAVPDTDALAERHRVDLARLSGREFVEYRSDSALRSRIDATFDSLGVRRTSVCEVDTIPDLVDAVAHGLGIALLPAETVRDHPRIRAIATRPRISRELVLVYSADRPPSPAARAFLTGLGNRRRRDIVDG